MFASLSFVNTICLWKPHTVYMYIALETGRYQNVPYEERLCIICNLGNIEDEFHCFMSCSAYNYLRSQLFNVISNLDPIFSTLSLHQQLLYLMSSDSLCCPIASFANQILTCRSKATQIINDYLWISSLHIFFLCLYSM